MLFDLYSDPGRPDLRSPWRFLWWVARGQTSNLVIGGIYGAAWMVLQASVPIALGSAVAAVLHRDRGALAVWTAVLLVLGVAQAVAGVARHRRAVANFMLAATRVSQLLSRTASRLGDRISREVAAGEVANLGANDVERLADVFDISARFVGAVVAYLAVTVVLLLTDPAIGAIVAVGAVVVVLAVGPLLRPIERRQGHERSARAAASSRAADTVVGLRVLRGLGGEAVFAERFRRESQGVRTAAVRTAQLQSVLDAGQVVLPQALVVAATWLAAHLAVHHQLSAGHLVTVYAYAAFLVLPVQTVVEMSSRATASRVAAGRLIAVLGVPDGVVDEVSPHSPSRHAVAPDAGGSADRPLPPTPALVPGSLHDPASGLEVVPGAFTAVVTPTPEESAALVARLGRWVETAGPRSVTLDGTPLAALDVADVRATILAIGREPVLLAGPLRDALDPPGASGQVALTDALAAAAADEIVTGLPDGLDTELPERARSLSGGQRQRVVLAQALVTDPRILILDEPTSAVDAHTEAAIGAALAALRRGRTTLVCTTSPLLLAHADRVVLLDRSVSAVGTHAQLLGSSSAYRDIVVRGAAEGHDGPERRPAGR